MLLPTQNLMKIARFEVFLVLCLGAFLFAVDYTTTHAQDPTPPDDAVLDPDVLATEGQSCAECHIDVAADMEGSPHALSYHDEVFQTTWEAQDSEASCLSCHTTGFEARTETFDHAGVTCEACHGETPANHPQEAVAIDPGAGVCADCHTSTYEEWELSGHGAADVACSSCHSPHPQEVILGGTQDLCLSCHEAEEILADNYAHESHPEETCASCHLHQTQSAEPVEVALADTTVTLDLSVDAAHIVTGELGYSGHDGIVEPVACESCHVEQDEDFQLIALNPEVLGNDEPLVEAQVRIQELEAERDTVEAQRQNTISLRVIQGLMVGAIIGGVIAFGVVGLRRRR